MSIVLRLKTIRETVPSSMSFSFVQIEYHVAGLFRPAKLSFFRSPSHKNKNEIHKVRVLKWVWLCHRRQNRNKMNEVRFFFKTKIWPHETNPLYGMYCSKAKFKALSS